MAFRILKKGGRALIVDWKDSFGGIGPQPHDVITERDAKRILGEVGFVATRSFPAGDHHYGIIAERP